MLKYLDFILVAAAVLAVVIYTAWVRHDAVKSERGTVALETASTVLEAQKVKNEIRNRPMSDRYLVKRLRAGSW